MTSSSGTGTPGTDVSCVPSATSRTSRRPSSPIVRARRSGWRRNTADVTTPSTVIGAKRSVRLVVSWTPTVVGPTLASDARRLHDVSAVGRGGEHGVVVGAAAERREGVTEGAGVEVVWSQPAVRGR